jgi:hypothetical protein
MMAEFALAFIRRTLCLLSGTFTFVPCCMSLPGMSCMSGDWGKRVEFHGNNNTNIATVAKTIRDRDTSLPRTKRKCSYVRLRRDRDSFKNCILRKKLH